jgi:GntR family transcriptional regulator, transcriptional repressor for pyruvate dehydrogenase complex
MIDTQTTKFMSGPRVGRGRSMSAELADQLRREIAEGRLTPGDRMPTETALVMSSGASRTVVREAIATLKAENLIETRQGSGSFVLPPDGSTHFSITGEELESLSDALHVLELRMAVEVEMAGAAAERSTLAQKRMLKQHLQTLEQAWRDGDAPEKADFELHRAIAQASNNPYFSRFMDFIGVRSVPARSVAVGRDQGNRAAYALQLEQEHAAIVRAISKSNIEEARAAARAHLQNSIRRHQDLRRDAVGETDDKR